MRADFSSRQPPTAGNPFLPDFCAAGPVLSVLLITQLVAILLTLARLPATTELWPQFLMLSLYLQWIGLCSAAALCGLRRWLMMASGPVMALTCYAALLAVTWLISEFALLIAQRYALAPLADISRGEFLIRSLGVCAIVSALALRYFWLARQWRTQTLAEGNARYQMLQARIRPHFLFNSLNSIAALTALNPKLAEHAIEDLSALFRANLAEDAAAATLQEEVDLAQAYARIEQLRLGERLRLSWKLAPASLSARLPPLTLQPLIENAVRHGIEPLAEGGAVEVRADASDGVLELSVRNPATGDSGRPGRGEALENIRQRLNLLYGAGRAALLTEHNGNEFIVRLRVPSLS
ncbi:MAG: sensor histidine kinase [Nevskiales bacterium]